MKKYILNIRLKVRIYFAYFILFFSFFYSVIALVQEKLGGGSPWRTGEWLINYSGGFVRRGLFGELFLIFSPYGKNSIWILFGIQVLLYSIILTYFINFLHKALFNWSSIALVCSPAALPFVGWDVPGFARKEVLGLIVLVFLAILKQRSYKHSNILKFFIILLFGFSIFSSEVNSVMLPGVIYLLGPYDNYKLKRNLLVLLAFIITCTGVLLSLLYSGDKVKSFLVCNKIRSHGLNAQDLCSGSIAYLSMTIKESIKLVSGYFPSYFGYVPLLILGLLPILTTKWFKANRIFVLVSALATFPLYIVAADYGRWIFILIMELTICLISSSKGSVESKAWTPLSCVLFVCLWGIPHFGLQSTMIWYGFVQTFLRAAHSFI